MTTSPHSMLYFTGILMALLLVFIAVSHEYKTHSKYDPPIWTDEQTGCQYFMLRETMVPRLDSEGIPMCNCTGD